MENVILDIFKINLSKVSILSNPINEIQDVPNRSNIDIKKYNALFSDKYYWLIYINPMKPCKLWFGLIYAAQTNAKKTLIKVRPQVTDWIAISSLEARLSFTNIEVKGENLYLKNVL